MTKCRERIYQLIDQISEPWVDSHTVWPLLEEQLDELEGIAVEDLEDKIKVRRMLDL